MRILLVSHARKNPDAGASRIHHLLADGLRGRGHEVADVHLDDARSVADPIDLLARRLAFPQVMSRAARRAGAEGPEGFDVVMGSSGMTAPLFARLRRRDRDGAQRPLLVNHLHGLAVYDHLANTSQHDLGLAPTTLAYRLVTGPRQVAWDARGIAAADVTVVQNLRDASYLAQRFPTSPSVLVPPCVAPSLERLATSTATATSPRRGPRLVWFGTWEARKGAHLVPLALREIRRRHPQVRLTVGGTSRTPSEIREHFAVEDRASVEVLDHVSLARQAEVFRESSMLLFPSLSEGFGLAVIEAAAFGCVPVTTATGVGADHLVDGVHGAVVAPTSLHLAAAVGRLLDDPLELAAMSRRVAGLAATFSAAAMVDAYEDLFTGEGHARPAVPLLSRSAR